MVRRGHDADAGIRDFDAGRDPERLALEYKALRTTPFAFLCAACRLFYDESAPARLHSLCAVFGTCKIMQKMGSGH